MQTVTAKTITGKKIQFPKIEREDEQLQEIGYLALRARGDASQVRFMLADLEITHTHFSESHTLVFQAMLVLDESEDIIKAYSNDEIEITLQFDAKLLTENTRRVIDVTVRDPGHLLDQQGPGRRFWIRRIRGTSWERTYVMQFLGIQLF